MASTATDTRTTSRTGAAPSTRATSRITASACPRPEGALACGVPHLLVEGVNTALRGYQAQWLTEVVCEGGQERLETPQDVCHRGARQIGKDHTWAFECAVDMAFNDHQQWSIISASMSHSQDFLEETSRHLDFLEDLTRRAGHAFPRRLRDNTRQVWLDNGSRLNAYAATPKNAQGRRGNLILNEIGIMPRARLIYETAEAVVRGQRAQGLPAKWRIIGNASPRGSFFHEFWDGAFSKGWKKIVSTWESCFERWLTEDLGHTTEKARAWIALQVGDMIRRLGVAGFGQWYRCQWRNPAESFFDPALLDRQHYDPAAPPGDFPELGDPGVFQSVGWDPSRRKHPAGMVQALMGRGGQRHYWHRPRRLFRTPWHVQEDELDRLIEQRRTVAVVIDRQGIGDKPAEDAQRRWGRIVEPYAFSAPSRMALFNNLLDAFERAVAWVPLDLDLRMELDGIARLYNAHGVEGLRIPDEGDHHGDMVVAGAMATWGLTSPEARARRSARLARNPDNMARALGRASGHLRGHRR